MSSTGRGAQRKERDAYFSPDACAAALVRLLPIAPMERVLEPHVGGGAFARGIRALPFPVRLIGCDVHGWSAGFGHCDQRIVQDFLTIRGFFPQPTWIIGNPPYRDAEAHVRQALNLTGRHVAFLLRAAFLEGKSRLAFWKEHPARHVFFLSERPSFTEDGRTDSCMYAWFWWDSEHRGPGTHSVISWKGAD